MRYALFMWSLIACMPAWAADSYKVVGVKDGDSVVVLSPEKREIECRLEAVDAPEFCQAFGQAAKRSLSDLIYGRMVDVRITGQDHVYGRPLCRIFVNGIDVNKEHVKRGMAWVYRQYSSDLRLIALELEAKHERRGLWIDPNPMPPWEFRKQKRALKQEGKRGC